MNTPVLRLLFIFGFIASIDILVILFAGTSYFLLLFALFLMLLNTAPYFDFIPIALFGRKWYSENANISANLRKDKRLLIIGVLCSVILLGASILFILKGNVRLIDYI